MSTGGGDRYSSNRGLAGSDDDSDSPAAAPRASSASRSKQSKKQQMGGRRGNEPDFVDSSDEDIDEEEEARELEQLQQGFIVDDEDDEDEDEDDDDEDDEERSRRRRKHRRRHKKRRDRSTDSQGDNEENADETGENEEDGADGADGATGDGEAVVGRKLRRGHKKKRRVERSDEELDEEELADLRGEMGIANSDDDDNDDHHHDARNDEGTGHGSRARRDDLGFDDDDEDAEDAQDNRRGKGSRGYGYDAGYGYDSVGRNDYNDNVDDEDEDEDDDGGYRNQGFIEQDYEDEEDDGRHRRGSQSRNRRPQKTSSSSMSGSQHRQQQQRQRYSTPSNYYDAETEADLSLRMEIVDLFGDGHEYEYAMYDNNQDAEGEGSDYGDEEDEDGGYGRKSRKPVKLDELFEPAELQAKMMTRQDEDIRKTDIPERIQMRLGNIGNGTALTPLSKEQAEAATTYAMEQLRNDGVLVYSTSMRGPIFNVMALLGHDFAEPPYIINYCKDMLAVQRSEADIRRDGNRMAPLYTNEDQLWLISEYHAKFRALDARKNDAREAMNALKLNDSDNSGSQLNYENERGLISIEDLNQWINDTTDINSIQDVLDHLHLRFAESISNFNSNNNNNNSKTQKKTTTHSEYVNMMHSRAPQLSSQFGISVSGVLKNLSSGALSVQPSSQTLLPLEVADSYLSAKYVRSDSVLHAARDVFAYDIAFDPRIRERVRFRTLRDAKITCRPIRDDEPYPPSHSLFNLQFITAKPINDFANSAVWLQIKQAAEKGLLKCVIHAGNHLPENWSNQSLSSNVLNTVRNGFGIVDELTGIDESALPPIQPLLDAVRSDEFHSAAQAWSSERMASVRKAHSTWFQQLAYKWITSHLTQQAETFLYSELRKSFSSKIDVKQFVPQHLANNTQHSSKIACLTLDDFHPSAQPQPRGGGPGEQVTTIVVIDGNGKLIDKCSIVGYLSGSAPGANANTQHFIKFIRKNKPDTICITGDQVRAYNLSEDVRRILATTDHSTGKLLMSVRNYNANNDSNNGDGNEYSRNEPDEVPIPLMWVDDVVARFVRNSKNNNNDSKSENKNLSVVERYLLCAARCVVNPLTEYAVLPREVLFSLPLHPLQHLLSDDTRWRAIESTLVDNVCRAGVSINTVLSQPRLHPLLQYVAGLGPRKAAAIIDSLNSDSVAGKSSRSGKSNRYGMDEDEDEDYNDNDGEDGAGILIRRRDLKKRCNMGKRVYRNCAAFLKVSPWSDILDTTRIHPMHYKFARKMAAGALGIDLMDSEAEDTDDSDRESRTRSAASRRRRRNRDRSGRGNNNNNNDDDDEDDYSDEEEEDDRYSRRSSKRRSNRNEDRSRPVLQIITDNKMAQLDNLDLYEYSETLRKASLEAINEDINSGHRSKSKLKEIRLYETLKFIRNEIQQPFQNAQHNEFAPPSSSRVLNMLTGESLESTLRPGTLVTCHIYRVSDRLAVGRLDSGLECQITMEHATDDSKGMRRISDIISNDSVLRTVILRADPDRMFVELSARQSEVRTALDRQERAEAGLDLGYLATSLDRYYDLDLASRSLQEHARAVAARARAAASAAASSSMGASGAAMRRSAAVSVATSASRFAGHPDFQRITFQEAETYLANKPPGRFVVRPSSQGQDSLAITLKIDEKLFQHIAVQDIDAGGGNRYLVVGRNPREPLEAQQIEQLLQQQQQLEQQQRQQRQAAQSSSSSSSASLAAQTSLRKRGRRAPYIYTDLDHLIADYIERLVRRFSEIKQSDKFHDDNDTAKVGEKLYEISRRSGTGSYGLCLNYQHAGGVFIVAMVNRRANPKNYPVAVTPDAYWLGEAPFQSVRELFVGFKTMMLNADRNMSMNQHQQHHSSQQQQPQQSQHYSSQQRYQSQSQQQQQQQQHHSQYYHGQSRQQYARAH
ncbi:hypothetical protein GQ42DRAFT_162459 [Ramicandelaber brevisporus]|nr:hypothetical protein GQ42DRAFT_162459 [Ramicandelaber brevisporus]